MGCCQSVNQQSPRNYAESTTVDAAARVDQQEFLGWCKAGDHKKISTTLQGLQGDTTHRDTLLTAKTKRQHTPLHLAAVEGREATVQALVATGANLEAKTNSQNTPLHLAAREGKEGAVRTLVAAGANLEAQNMDQHTPLHLATMEGREAAVQVLVAAGANLEAKTKRHQHTPLHLAAAIGKEATVQALVATGANLEAQNMAQHTPLHLAAMEGREAVVRALVAAGANLEAQNMDQHTPLHLAASDGWEATVQALVAAGANLEAKTKSQHTPLHLAARRGKKAALQALVAAGANLEAQNYNHNTPLQLAEQKKHKSVEEALKAAASARLAAQHQNHAPLAAFLKALDLESHAVGIWESAGIAEPSDFSLLMEGGWAALQETNSLTNIQMKKLKRCAASNAAGLANAPSSNPYPPSLQTPLPNFLASLRLGAFAGRIRHALGVAHAGDLAFWAREADWEGLCLFMKKVQVAKLRKAIDHQAGGKSCHDSSIEEEAEEFVAGLLLSARVLPCSPLVDFLGCLGLCQCAGRMKELLGVYRAEDLTLADASELAALRNFMTQIQVAKLELAVRCLMKHRGNNNETTKDAAPPAGVPLPEYLESIGLPPNLSFHIQRTIGASQAEDLALAEDRDWATLRSFMTRIQVEKLQLAVQGRTVSSSYCGFRNKQREEEEKEDDGPLKQSDGPTKADRPTQARNFDSCENKLRKDGGTTKVKGVQESKNSCRPCNPADAESTTGKVNQVLAEEKTDNENSSTLYQYKTTQPSAPAGLPPEEKSPRDGEEENLCCVCLDQPKTVVLLPCRHMCLCSECAAKMALCPLCKEEITQSIQAFT